MKIFFYESESWTEITTIKLLPQCVLVLDSSITIVFQLDDNNGALYETWKDRDWLPLKIEDENENIIWRGYIIGKDYAHNLLTITAKSISGLLEWTLFNQNYLLESGKIKDVSYGDDTTALRLQDEEDTLFTWNNDYFVNNRDCAILITDNTKTNLQKSWILQNNVNITGANAEDEDYAKAIGLNDGQYLYGRDQDVNFDMIIGDIDVGGDVIADSYYIQKISINYHFLLYNCNINGDFVNPTIKLQIYNSLFGWLTIREVSIYFDGTYETWNFGYGYRGDWKIVAHPDSLKVYLHKDGANYTKIKLRLKLEGTSHINEANNYVEVRLDYIEGIVEYNTKDISPIMEKITSNTASVVKCSGINWDNAGVAVDDKFQIGESTSTILNNLSVKIGKEIRIIGTLNKYIARNMRGEFCLPVIKSIMELEGGHYAEDPASDRIDFIQEDSFPSSGIELTPENYTWGFDIGDQCNNYSQVQVIGNASLNVEAFSDYDPDNTSLQVKQIKDDTIMTYADAKAIADREYAIYKNKTPSIKINLVGTYPNAICGRTVNITFERPTIASADYVIRKIEREAFGLDIKTVLYLGLGHTNPIDPNDQQERLESELNHLYWMIQKAQTNKISGTAWSSGAYINWDDVKNAPAGARAAIGNIIGDDGKLDANLDADSHKIINLSAPADANDSIRKTELDTHTGVAAAHHVKYTDAEARTAVVSDDSFSDNWNGVTDYAASKNAVYDINTQIIDQITALRYCLNYEGNWNASLETAPSANPNDGDYWICTVAGNWDGRDWEVTDFIVWEATSAYWYQVKFFRTAPIISVKGNESIQSAINQVSAMGGGTVIIGSGTFNPDNDSFPLTMNDATNPHLRIIGQGATTIIDPAGDSTIFDVDQIGSLYMSDFKIDATDITTQGKHIISLYDPNNHRMTLERIDVIGDQEKGSGIVTGSNNITIRDCYVNGLYIGIFLYSNECYIYNCTVKNCYRNIAGAGQHGIIMGCISDNASDRAIDLQNADYTLVSSCQILNSPTGISIDAATTNAKIGVNQFYNCTNDIINLGTNTELPYKLVYDTSDPVAHDITQANLTIDSAWHELDLDNYKTVPKGVRGFYAYIEINGNTSGKYIVIRDTSQVRDIQVIKGRVQVADQAYQFHAIIPLDSGHKFDYYITTGTSTINITVLWWIY